MRLVHFSVPSALLTTGMLAGIGMLGGCAAEGPPDASSSVALSSAHDSAFLPYVGVDVVAQRVSAFQQRNGADWEVQPVGDQRRFIASPGSMKSNAAVGPVKELSREEARVVARDFLAKNADLVSIDATTIDANLDVYKNADGLGGDTYLGWTVSLKTPPPTTALYPDSSSYNSSLWVGIEVDGRVHEITDPPARMPAVALDLEAPHGPLDAAMTATFLGKDVQKTDLECNSSTLELVEVTHDLGTISASDLAPVKVLRSLPKANGVEVHLAYDYRLTRFGWEYVVDATNAEVFYAFEPTHSFGGSLGACW